MESYDIIILGAGPAGIQAAIHASRRGVRVCVAGKMERSAAYKGHIENYAFVGGKSDGSELLKIGNEQMSRFGARLLEEDAVGLSPGGEGFVLRFESGKELAAKAVILATGTARKKLGIKGESEFEGKGVSYCADCDAGFFRRKRVLVAGDGSAAASGALHLLHFTQDVTLVAEKLDIAPGLREELSSSKVKVIMERKLAEIAGDDVVKEAVLTDGTRIPVDGVFIEKGAKGVLELGAALGLALNEEGHIAVDRNMATNVSGVFAAGDVTGPPWQMAKAVGEGCVAGLRAAEHVKSGGKG